MFVLKDNRLDEAFQQTLIKEVKMPEFYHMIAELEGIEMI